MVWSSGSEDGEWVPDPDLEDTLIRDQAEEVEQRRGAEAASRWLNTALSTKLLFSEAMDRYREERQGDLTRSTCDNLLTEKKRFMEWMQGDPALEDVTRAQVHEYLVKHLPEVKTHKAPDGLSRSTIQRTQTLMKGLWDWAASCGILDIEGRNPWEKHRLPKVSTSKGVDLQNFNGPGSEDLARMYGPEEWNTLIEAAYQSLKGPALGDALVLSISTGCRLSEVVERLIGEVEVGPLSVSEGTSTDLPEARGIGFFVPKGKTVNARRYAPVHEGTRAAEVLVRRLSAAQPSDVSRTGWRASLGYRLPVPRPPRPHDHRQARHGDFEGDGQGPP